MQTVDYIKQYSKLYHEYKSNYADELGDLDSVMEQYTYIPKPSRAELPGQIELHMFWQIPLPLALVAELEYWIRHGVFFKSNPDVYYHVNKKYWPLIREIADVELDCANTTEEDYTWSMDLYKKAPWHFDIAESNYNSLECLKAIAAPTSLFRLVDVECVTYLLERGVHSDFAMLSAAELGQLDIIKVMHAYDVPWLNAIYVAAKHGHLHCLEYMYENKVNWSSKWEPGMTPFIKIYNAGMSPSCTAMQGAAEGGHLKCIEYMHAKGADFEYAAHVAAMCGHLACMVYIMNHGGNTVNLVKYVAKGGHLNCVTYMHEIGMNICDYVRIAISDGHLDATVYMLKHNTDYTSAFRDACEYGNVRVIDYLLDSGYVLTDSDYKTMVIFSSKCTITYMHSRGVNLIKLMEYAVCRGDVNTVTFLHNMGISFGNSMELVHSLSYTERMYHSIFECVKYMHSCGVKWTTLPRIIGDTVTYLRYMRKHNIPHGNIMASVIERLELAGIRYAYELGWSHGNILDVLAAHVNVNRVKDIEECTLYMFNLGYSGVRAMEIAASVDNLEVMRVLHLKGVPFGSTETYVDAHQHKDYIRGL